MYKTSMWLVHAIFPSLRYWQGPGQDQDQDQDRHENTGYAARHEQDQKEIRRLKGMVQAMADEKRQLAAEMEALTERNRRLEVRVDTEHANFVKLRDMNGG